MLAIGLFFFFFQAEDGIRDIGVTGVQTCALPISYYRDKLHVFAACGPGSVVVSPQARPVAEQHLDPAVLEIGRASCRERVEISVVAVSLKKKKNKYIYDNRDER